MPEGLVLGDDIALVVSNGVAHVEFTREEKLNALSRQTLDGLMQIVRWVGVEESVRAVLISDRGRMFCSGDDLDGLAPVHGAGPNALTEIYEGPNSVVHRLLTCRKPIVAAVTGGAYVAGLDIALACDFRIASPETRLGPVGLTLANAGCMALLPMYLGFPAAKRIMFRAKPIGGEEALVLGLVDELVPADQVVARGLELATELAQGPTLAYAATKSALLAMMGMSPLVALHLDQDYSVAGYGANDAKEALAAWQERRTPTFTGS